MRLEMTSKPVAIPLGLIWLAALAAGVVGVGLRISSGHELADYTSSIPWGLWVATYAWLTGLSVGLFLVVAVTWVFRVEKLLPFVKLGLFASIVLLLAGLLTVWLDLGQPLRFYTVYTRGSIESMMAWMVWLYTLYLFVALAAFWLVIRGDLAEAAARGGGSARVAALLALGRTDTSEAARETDHRTAGVLFIIGIPLVIAAIGGSGALFGVVGGRAYWNAPLMPILFISASLTSGTALLALIIGALGTSGEDERRRDAMTILGRLLLAMLVVYVVLLWAEYSVTLYADIPASSQAAYQVLGGPYPWVFWVFQVALGSMIPLVILLARPQAPPWVAVAGFLVAGSFLATRLNIVIPGLVEPQIAGLDVAYVDARLSYDYFPSLMEWLVLSFIGAFATGLFVLGLRALPLVDQHKEASS